MTATTTRRTPASGRLQVVACKAIEAKAGRVLLVPWGRVDLVDGKHFIVDANTGRATAERFAQFGKDMVLDYQHQTLGGRYTSPDGRAPAAGWIKAVETVPNVGIFGRVEFTPQASQEIACGQYRYISPVVFADPDTHHANFLYNAALVNDPAIKGMPAIVVNSARLDALGNLSFDSPDLDGGGITERALLAILKCDSAAPREELQRISRDLQSVVACSATPPTGTIECQRMVNAALNRMGGAGHPTGGRVGNEAQELRLLKMYAGTRYRQWTGQQPPVVWTEGQRIACRAGSPAATSSPIIPSSVNHRPAPDRRTAVILAASARYDEDGISRSIRCNRVEYINRSLQSDGLVMLTGSELANYTGPAARALVIGNASRLYDREAGNGLPMVCSRIAFINGDLHKQGMVLLTNDERQQYSNDAPPKTTSPRAEVIANASRAYDQENDATRRVCSRLDFINGELQAQGLTLLAASEKGLYANDTAPKTSQPRAVVIANASREFDRGAAEGLAMVCSRVAFINGALRDEGMALLADGERGQYASDTAPKTDQPRAEVIANASRAYDQENDKTRMVCSRVAYITGELHAQGMALLTASEKDLLAPDGQRRFPGH